MLPNKSDYDLLGGEKTDYQDPEDATTDRSAEQVNEAFVDVAAMTRTAIRAYVVFTILGGVGTVVEHEAVWGNTDSVKPTILYSAAGQYQITWPSTITDARGNTQAVALRRGWGNVADTHYTVHIAPAANPNKMAVNVDNGTTAADPTGAVTVFVL